MLCATTILENCAKSKKKEILQMKWQVGDWVKLKDTWYNKTYMGATKNVPVKIIAMNSDGNFNIDTDQCRTKKEIQCTPEYWDFVRRGPRKRFFK